MAKKEYLTGKKFGRLLVLREASINERIKTKGTNSQWVCLCDCGNIKTYLATSLKTGNTKSCGCLSREKRKLGNVIHGLAYHELQSTYQNMISRCNNKNNKEYKNYGGRGIKVCSEWMSSFKNFLSDMGERPSKIHSLDRIDNNGNYCKENCRWATQREQASNKRVNRMIVFNGVEDTVSNMAKRHGLIYTTLHYRLKYLGWSVEKSILTPPRNKVNQASI